MLTSEPISLNSDILIPLNPASLTSCIPSPSISSHTKSPILPSPNINPASILNSSSPEKNSNRSVVPSPLAYVTSESAELIPASGTVNPEPSGASNFR